MAARVWSARLPSSTDFLLFRLHHNNKNLFERGGNLKERNKNMKKVTLLIPCYNEESSLPALHAALCEVMDSQVQYQWEVLLIDDGSRDQ